MPNFSWLKFWATEPVSQVRYSNIIEDFRNEQKPEPDTTDFRMMPVEHPGELAPCPFCGGKAVEITTIYKELTFDTKPNNSFHTHIECERCGCRSKAMMVNKMLDPFPELKNAWNSRTDNLQSENFRLKRFLADSEAPCIYCQMPKSHMVGCSDLCGQQCQRALDLNRE